MCKRGFFLFFFVLFLSFSSIAQPLPESKNGKTLPVTGVLRVLIIYAEINYDVNPQKDPVPEGTSGWPKHQLPQWRDELFDAFANEKESIGKLTRFYRESSFDSFLVLGDYLSAIVTLNESDIREVNWDYAKTKVLEAVSKTGSLNTSKSFGIEDFDNWTLTSDGHPKITPSKDSPHRFDHIMIVFRNLYDLCDHCGRASPGSAGSLLGFSSDSYSVFKSSNGIPFDIARHEFSHLMIGDNNFHAGGQTDPWGPNYFISPGGWSLMGGASSSLLTCNGWDRDRFDWKGPGKQMSISALTSNGEEVNTDLDPTKQASAGVYILRDFVTTGDALRIKIPFLNHGEYPQWIWIENHQTIVNNKSDFDKFHMQGNASIDNATPGLYMYMQVDKEMKKGAQIYGGYGDFLRPITAEGFYDYTFYAGNKLEMFEKESQLQNPFTGNQDQECPAWDKNGDDRIDRNERYIPINEKSGNDTIRNFPFYGDKKDAFTLHGKRKIGIGTNPSTAPMITFAGGNEARKFNFRAGDKGVYDNKKIILNGISAEIIEEMADGAIKIKVRFDDVDIAEDVRWCADSVILPAKQPGVSFSMNIASKCTVRLDQGLTPTRMINPISFKERKIFASPTNFICADSSFLHLEPDAKIIVDNGSHLHLQTNSKIELAKNAEIIVERGAKLIVDKGAKLIIKKGARVLVKATGGVEFAKNSIVVEKGGRFKIEKK